MVELKSKVGQKPTSLSPTNQFVSQCTVCSNDVGPPTGNPSEDIVYNNSTETSSFLRVGEQQQEIEAVRNQLSENKPMQWPSVENEPLNESDTRPHHICPQWLSQLYFLMGKVILQIKDF